MRCLVLTLGWIWVMMMGGAMLACCTPSIAIEDALLLRRQAGGPSLLPLHVSHRHFLRITFFFGLVSAARNGDELRVWWRGE